MRLLPQQREAEAGTGYTMSGDYGVINNPERALWQMVLLQAVHDALHGPKGVPPYQRARMWKEARANVTKPSENLAMVCAMAGVEMNVVVQRMWVQIDKALTSEEQSDWRSKKLA